MKACSEGLLPSCFGQNNGAAYCVLTLPPAPGQDPATGQNPPAGYVAGNPGNYPANPNFYPPGGSYRLRPDEALVFIGKTPPECTYFSFIPYIGLTENKVGKDYSGIFTTGNDTVGNYHRIFGSLNDPLNNFNILTENSAGGAAASPFSSMTVIIATADRGISSRIHSTLASAGYPSSMVNQHVFPSGTVRMGLEKGRDTFVYLVRATIWKDENAGQDYLNKFSSYGKVFRVTPTAAAPLDPYDMPALKPRGTGKTEFELVRGLSQDLDTLRASIIQRYATTGFTYAEYATTMWVPDGLVGYTNDTDALADNRDATYLKTPSFQFDSDDDFAIVYGVNHDTTGKTIYNNNVFYGQQLLNGVASVFSSIFPGTASAFFPAGYEGASRYYVCKMARKQSSPGENCVIIPYSTGNPDGKAFGVDNNQDAFVACRAYIEKATGIGPAYSELCADRVIVFHRK
jgi:hypothetical protein